MSGLETPRGKQLAVNALATWQNHHGALSEEQRAVFITRQELLLLVNVSDEVLSHAISKHRRIIEFVPYALACQLEILRKQAGESDSGQPEPEATKSKLNRPQGSKPARKPPKPASNSKSQKPNTSTAGVSHRASGFSGKPRQMRPEFDDTEPCSQCGARISASAAALHECHY